MTLCRRCNCSGKCGSRTCMRNNSSGYRLVGVGGKRQKIEICMREVGACDMYCTDCVCMRVHCLRPRRNSMQFCLAHHKDYQSLRRNSYMNQHGEHKFDQEVLQRTYIGRKTFFGFLVKCVQVTLGAFNAAADGMVGTRTALNCRDSVNFYAIGILKLPHVVE